MITAERVEQLLNNEQVEFTRSSTPDCEQWELHTEDLPTWLTLSPTGEHLIIRTGRMTRGRVRPGDQPLFESISEVRTPSLQGAVDEQRRYVIDLHLPGRKGLSQRRFFRALLEASATYCHVMRISIKTAAPAAC